MAGLMDIVSAAASIGGGVISKVAAPVSSLVVDALLKSATGVFTAASNAATVDSVLEVIRHSVEALTESLGGAVIILRGIFKNNINEDSLSFILNSLPALLQFLYDLIRPANVIPGQAALNHALNGAAATVNQYNEFDLSKVRNRMAVIYQLQRLALSCIEILKAGREPAPQNGLEGFRMNASLNSDLDKNGRPPPPTCHFHHAASPSNEKWFFINGIANEFVWLEGSCEKVCDTFHRDVVGIFNRSDGILWDLIECCGERSAAKHNPLLELTESSMAAQRVIDRELRDALAADGLDKVIVIAHSQGCLLLRLVLQGMVSEGTLTKDMQKKLRVFTFGNPSVDWKVEKGANYYPLSRFASTTEHFAHQRDFVAMLGVVTHQADYGNDRVFHSNGGRGHLFGAHYPLGAHEYQNGGDSELLRAVNGHAIN